MVFDLVKADRIKSWAYRWSYTHFNHHGLSIVPSKNLVQNIGFGEDSTNTKFGKKTLSRRVGRLRFPLTHPTELVVNQSADDYTGKTLYATTKNLIVLSIKKWIPFA
jgi:hypothetical protein